MRRAKIAIATVLNRGRTLYRLTYPTSEGRKRELFGTEEKAKIRMKEIQGDAERFGSAAAGMSAELRADAISAERILSGSGRTLVEAARFFMAELKRTESGVPVAEAVEMFLRSRDARSDRYRQTLGHRMKFIAGFFADRTTAGLKADDCQRLLDAVGATHSARTVSHYRTHMSVFFKFCESRGWISGNPSKGSSPVKVAVEDVEILSAVDAESLLAACHRDLLPGVVMALFCGLRQAEIERLNWTAISLTQAIITIGAGVAKTNSRRIVPIPENAIAWLGTCAQDEGCVWPSSKTRARDLWTLSRIQAGYGPFFTDYQPAHKAQIDPKTKKKRKDLKPWPANVLRHSAISYRLAQEKDLAKVAYESGNSPGIIQRHYNGLASPEAAKAFFAIMPKTVGEGSNSKGTA